MLMLIFIVALRLVARLVRAVAPRPWQLPAVSLLDPLAGEMSSLLTWSSNLAQILDLTRNYRYEMADFRDETKILPELRERGPPRGQNMPRPRMPSVGSRLARTRRPIRSRRVSVVPPPRVP